MARPWQLLLVSLLAPLVPLTTTATKGNLDGPRIEEVEFASHRVTLSGSIAWPANREVRAAVVFIHGSGKQTRNLAVASRFADAGIAALVYDKRGVGKSGGTYESEQSVSERNLALLADDASAALTVLASRPSLRGVPLGFAGISQAGWIAPIAARRNKNTKFLVLWSGPVCKVSEEDIFSKYTGDSNVAANAVPTFQLALDARTEPYVWPDFLGVDTDPRTSLQELAIPGFWIYSDNDPSIPVDLSITGLRSLRDAGHRFDYALFSGLGHENIDGTFATVVDWIMRLPK